ncbi:PilZ domain-containing protein [Peribacillus sp. NPDC097675]|uniref:PilZ domain-containing protein n=1 Tax=Peribacillus sp. NPDC097675 TaxID=3390618 RepID=UPI003CFF3A72
MNVIVKNPDQFNSGDTVICLYESQKFETKIIKKQDNNLYLFVPWFKSLQDSERRRAARVSYIVDGQVQFGTKIERVRLIDLSIKGIGFSSENKLMNTELHMISFMLEDVMNHFTIRIQNAQKVDDLYRYGGSFVGVSVKDLFYVRRYILNSQLDKLSTLAI